MAEVTKEIRNMKEEWSYYEKMVIHPDAGEIQRTVMRQAFFAGAYVALGKTLTIAQLEINDEIMDTKMMELYEAVKEEAKKIGEK